MNRRNVLKIGGTALGSAVIPLQTKAENGMNSGKKLKILVTGAHPDDPETGCGGTIARYVAEGHEVKLLYLTRGEAGIEGVSHENSAQIRTKEAIEANIILGTKPIFFGQIDGSTLIDKAAYEKMISILNEEKPDVLFTHWPIDTHRDHRICATLVYDAWLYTGRSNAFYYYEVMTGSQSQNFLPSHFVDISKVVETKWKSCFIHQSQKIEETYNQDHGKMEIFRGMEYNCRYAEAFIHLQQSTVGYLPDTLRQI
jgi:LmbE family N-acetylglucosaminyl deacetylase